MEQPLADAAATPSAAEGEVPAPPPVVATKSEPVQLVSEYEPTPAVGEEEEDEDSKADVAQQIQDLQAAQQSEQDSASHAQQQVHFDI